MKKIIIVLLILFSRIVLCESETVLFNGFIFPDALIEIEESAFEGTAADIIILSENVRTIGDGSFANNASLKAIYVPESVIAIGKNAFGKDVFLTGMEQSYAYEWSKANKRHFSVYPTLKNGGRQVIAVYSNIQKVKLAGCLGSYQTISDGYKHSPGLTIGEITYLRITRNTDFRIEGRAPPAHVFVD